MTNLETLASIGAVTVLLALWMYGAILGFLAGRPTKVEAQILVRAMQNHERSPDPIMADKEAKLLKALQKRSEGLL